MGRAINAVTGSDSEPDQQPPNVPNGRTRLCAKTFLRFFNLTKHDPNKDNTK
jgi:hypothetical protein